MVMIMTMKIVIMVIDDLLTAPPDFQYQNVYVEENPPSSFDRTLTVNYRLITCQPFPLIHNDYNVYNDNHDYESNNYDVE